MPEPHNYLASPTRRGFVAGTVALLGGALPTIGDEPDADAAALGPRYGEPVERNYEIGLELTGGSKRGSKVVVVLIVPTDWPEQKATIVDVDRSNLITKIDYRTLLGGVKQMVVTIPSLPARAQVDLLAKVKVEVRTIAPPADTKRLIVPKRIPPLLRRFLTPSPLIEATHPTIRKAAQDTVSDNMSAWQRVEALHRFVHAKLQYKFARKNISAANALRDGVGDCGEFSSLFIALCRASKIPARLVHIPGHAYAEFYLEDDQRGGHWFPCEAVDGKTPLGTMTRTAMILQKGDRFRTPEDNRTCRISIPVIVGRFPAGGTNPIFRTILREPGSTERIRVLPSE